MRLFGLLLVLMGGAGTVWSITAASARRRPVDVAAALLAPVAILVALTGGVLLFVPGFLR
jgi:UPF0716 family protein affecting phage T7 exclusion